MELRTLWVRLDEVDMSPAEVLEAVHALSETGAVLNYAICSCDIIKIDIDPVKAEMVLEYFNKGDDDA